MKLKGSTVLVTGANRGLGLSFVKALREAGCAKVYAGARRIETLASDGVIVSIQLDITNAEHITSAVARCGDVNVLINNAGIAGCTPALGAPTMANARLEMETNQLFWNVSDVPRFCASLETQRWRRVGECAVGCQLV